MTSIKVDVTKTQGGLLVKIDDPRWQVKQTAAGILIKPVPGSELEQALDASIKAMNPGEILARLRGELRGLYVDRLRDMCRKAGLSKKGRKAELIERLIDHARVHGAVEKAGA